MPLQSLIAASIKPQSQTKVIWIIGISTLVFTIMWKFPVMPNDVVINQYTPLHTILEIFSVVIAGIIFAIGWQCRRLFGITRMALCAAGFLGVAMLDVAHILSFKGMPDWVTHSGAGKGIYFWFSARFLAALSIMVLVVGQEYRTFRRGTDWGTLSIIMAIVFITIWLVLYHQYSLPIFLIVGKGLTTKKIVVEWLLIGLLFLIMVVTWRKRSNNILFDTKYIVLALWLSILSELSFTLYSSASDMFNIMGHILKVASYGFLYRAIVSGNLQLFNNFLAQSQTLINQLVTHIQQVFWITTADNKQVLYVSPAYEKIWLQPRQNLMKSSISWTETIHPEDRERVKRELENLTEQDKSIEYRIQRPDNTERLVCTRIFSFPDVDGETVRIAGVSEDITEKKHADETNQQLELSFQNLVNAAPDAIIITNSQHLITLVNSQVELIFDYRLKDLHNQRIDKVISSRYHDIHKDSLRLIERDSLSRSKVLHLEIYGIKSNGDEFPMDVNLSSLETGGKIQYTYILRDVSSRVNIEEERRQLQEQLAQAQKIEAIGHLTGGIAHDFNNILGAIIGYGSLLKDIIDAKSKNNTTKEQAYVGQILVACTRAKELVAQMMAFSRLNPATDDNLVPTILVQPVLKEVIQLLRSSIPSTIALNYDIENDKLKANIEPVKLHQILLNLAINSRDAIESYGRINLMASNELISDHILCNSCRERFSGDFLALEICDSGHGIPDEIIAKMFEPFFTTKEVGKGTGMGLSMVHGVVHSAGGHIKVESNIGQGTSITILLPTVPDEEINILETPIRKPLVSSGLLSKLHIMLVDDEQSILFMLYELLTMYGAEVTIYNHPEDAIAAFKRNPDAIDLLITDQTMPDYSGLDMCREIMAIRSNLPIILCTGFSETVNASIAEKNGIAAFVYKPLDINQLLDIIHNVINNEVELLN